jgi:hypothetical protein
MTDDELDEQRRLAGAEWLIAKALTPQGQAAGALDYLRALYMSEQDWKLGRKPWLSPYIKDREPAPKFGGEDEILDAHRTLSKKLSRLVDPKTIRVSCGCITIEKKTTANLSCILDAIRALDDEAAAPADPVR